MSGSVSSIPPKYHADVLRLSSEGCRSAEISEWLDKTHGVAVDARIIRRLLQRHKDEQADAAKVEARQLLRRQVRVAVQDILAVRHQAIQWARKAELGNNGDLAMKALDRRLKAADMIMHYVGLDQPDAAVAGPGKVTDEELLQRVKALAAEAIDPAVH